MTAQSPLSEQHRALGARFVDFAGWEMPLQYQSVLAEHRAVRQGVGVFDVSHLGRLAVTGANATAALTSLFTNDVRRLLPGRTHYTMLLNEAGGILDDMVVWKWGEDEYWVMPNAANAEVVAAALAAKGAEVVDLRPSTAMLAVQGPSAPDLMAAVVGEAPGRFRTARRDHLAMAGTGYTGEAGGEICVPAAEAADLHRALVEAGATPCGLGARDTLRLEAGLALWGSDIDATTTPLEAGLDFAVSWDHDFPGREALVEQSQRTPGRRLQGLVLEGRGIPRHGHPVRVGEATGAVTSGNLSPVLGTGIALAYLSPPVPVGSAGTVEIRQRPVPLRVVEPPFIRQ